MLQNINYINLFLLVFFVIFHQNSKYHSLTLICIEFLECCSAYMHITYTIDRFSVLAVNQNTA